MAARSRRGKKLVDEKAGPVNCSAGPFQLNRLHFPPPPLGLEISVSVNPRLTPLRPTQGTL